MGITISVWQQVYCGHNYCILSPFQALSLSDSEKESRHPSTPAPARTHRQTLITSFNFSKWKFVFLLLRVKIQIINSFKWNAIKMKWYVLFFLGTRLKYVVWVWVVCIVCICVCTAHEMTVAKLYETAASRGQRKETTITKGDEKKSHKHFKWMDGQTWIRRVFSRDFWPNRLFILVWGRHRWIFVFFRLFHTGLHFNKHSVRRFFCSSPGYKSLSAISLCWFFASQHTL